MVGDAAPDHEESEADRSDLRFYALIGYYITHYQTVEDYLPTVFAGALGGSELRSRALFNLARGLEAKIDAISAALTEASQAQQDRWSVLVKRIAAAAAARNQIAHATPTQTSSIKVEISREPGVPSRVLEQTPTRMELRKHGKAGGIVWTYETMLEELNKTDRLFKHLIGFAKELKGEPVPEHLRE